MSGDKPVDSAAAAITPGTTPVASPSPAASPAAPAAGSVPGSQATPAAAANPTSTAEPAPNATGEGTAPAQSPTVEPGSGSTAPASETPANEAKPAEKSLLGGDIVEDDPAAAPPVEGEAPPAAEGEKKEEGSQSADPAPLPSYEKFTAPEGMTFDDAKLGEFTKDLGEFEAATKADHAEVQKLGQRMMDKYVAEMQTVSGRIHELYQNTWEKQKADWKEASEKDPDFGGNRFRTTMNSAIEFINTHGGTPAHRAELIKMFDDTGIGNHPALIRLLANASLAMREGKPLPATKGDVSAKSKKPYEKMYSSS